MMVYLEVNRCEKMGKSDVTISYDRNPFLQGRHVMSQKGLKTLLVKKNTKYLRSNQKHMNDTGGKNDENGAFFYFDNERFEFRQGFRTGVDR